jgi:hypothetical protein
MSQRKICLSRELSPGWASDYSYRTVRIHPDIMLERGIDPRDTAVVGGEAAVKVWRKNQDSDEVTVALDPYIFETTGLEPGQDVKIESHSNGKELDAVTLQAVNLDSPIHGLQGCPSKTAHLALNNRPINQDSENPVLHLQTDQGNTGFVAVETEPGEVGWVTPRTEFRFETLDGETRFWNRRKETSTEDGRPVDEKAV